MAPVLPQFFLWAVSSIIVKAQKSPAPLRFSYSPNLVFLECQHNVRVLVKLQPGCASFGAVGNKLWQVLSCRAVNIYKPPQKLLRMIFHWAYIFYLNKWVSSANKGPSNVLCIAGLLRDGL